MFSRRRILPEAAPGTCFAVKIARSQTIAALQYSSERISASIWYAYGLGRLREEVLNPLTDPVHYSLCIFDRTDG